MSRWAFFVLMLSGCSQSTFHIHPVKVSNPETELSTKFDRTQCGTIVGQVTEQGRPVEGAFVWLKGIEPNRSKPYPDGWNETQLTIEENGRFRLSQQLLKPGSIIHFESRHDRPQVVTVRGAVNASVPLVAKNSKGTRPALQTGDVLFTSNSLLPQARAELIVCEHPYFAVTDAQGRYELRDIPTGEYDLHARAANSEVIKHERDPELGHITRVYFAPPFASVDRVRVQAGRTDEWVLSVISPR